MIGLMLGVLLSLAVVSFTMSSGRSLANLFNYVDMQYSSRQTLDIMSRDMRQVAYLSAFATNKLEFVQANGQKLVFEYDAAKGTLSRTDGTNATKVLLKQCDYLQFAIYQRAPKTGTFDHDVSTNPSSAKIINVSWNCWRSILGAKLTTESVQGAKIVIRN